MSRRINEALLRTIPGVALLIFAFVLLSGTGESDIAQVAASGNSQSFVYLPLLQNRPLPAGYDWLQFGFDVKHSGNNPVESRLSAANAGALHLVFQRPLGFTIDGAPAYLTNVATRLGARNLLFVTSQAGDVVALDADDGSQVWANTSYEPGSCLINQDQNRNQTCFTTSSPAIDPNRQFVYSYGMDGAVHKFAVGSGAETRTSGWPEPTTLKGYDEKASAALSIATTKSSVSYLYVSHAGYPGDAGDYQGHITAINLNDGTQHVFNTLCSNQAVHFVDSRVGPGPDCFPETQTGVWARPGVVYNAENDRIYLATGNGIFNPGAFKWGDSILALNPDGTSAGGKPLDSYTPTSFQMLQNSDLDLGSTAPAILPPVAGRYPHLAIQGGKDSTLRLVNLDNLSGQGGAGHIGGEVFSMAVPMGGEVLTQPAVWTNPIDGGVWVFVANDHGSAGLQLIVDGSSIPSLSTKWTGSPGTSPIVANGILFYAQSNLISGLNPTDGHLLWSDNRIGSLHWASPIVANGTLYIADLQGSLTAYGLP